jgi:argininosuccinate lyase
MLGRDDKRLGDINGNMKITIGAGALAGTPIHSREYGSSPWSLLKKKGLMDLKDALNLQMTENSIDAVSDRDFVIEIISALSIAAMHLSRLAEDFIIWSTKEFDLLDIDESFCTGSSLMPHKKNPDPLELIRGYSGRIYGNLVSVLTMMKGLPLAYNRDMQLDKEPLFDSFEILGMELEILKDLIATLKFNENAIGPALRDESLYTTDIVYYLVDKGVPFKSAHTIVGKIVRHSSESGIPIKDMSEGRLKRFSARIVKNEILRLFDPHLSVRSKRSVNRAKR